MWNSQGGQGGFIAAGKPLKVSAERNACLSSNKLLVPCNLAALPPLGHKIFLTHVSVPFLSPHE